MSEILYFKSPVFTIGTNITVRRGVKWDILPKNDVSIHETDSNIQLGYARNIRSYVISFQDLKADDLIKEHDPRCRTPLGLLQVMRETYPGFNEAEIVTVLTFEFEGI